MSENTEPSTAVVVHHDPFHVMDTWDEEALLQEMQGAIAKTLVYEFQQGGQTITGLSKVGVDECCLVLAEQGQVIREEEIEYTILGEGEQREALFKARAARYAVGTGGEVLLDKVLGVKRQPLYEMRKGKLTLNPFWFEVGAMKAIRNARFRLIPGKVREGVIAAAKQVGNVRHASDRGQRGGIADVSYEREAAAEAVALRELESLLPTLPENQRTYVKNKLGDGAAAAGLLEFVKARTHKEAVS